MRRTTDNFDRYSSLPTERENRRTLDLDRIPLRRVLEKLNREDAGVPRAVARAIPAIEKAAREVSRTFLRGGRIVFIGAGTSGRLGVLEAAELPPTYGVKPGTFKALMAGGDGAVFLSKEGAEDSRANGFREISRCVKKGDVVVGIAASGVTPYVLGGLEAAGKSGAFGVLLTCNYREKVPVARCVIAIDAGPEPISGSTRMKSGTATKLALNMLTTSAMVISGKVYRNWMVDVRTTSRKLELRAARIVSRLGGVDPEEAGRLLAETGDEVKTAIVMARKGLSREAARALIKGHKGFLRPILG